MNSPKREFLKGKFFHLLTQIILPVIAILISVYLFYAGKENRELTITGLQATNLVETKNEISNGIAVTFKGDTIYNTVRFLLEIKNTGTKSITKQDVYRFNWISPSEYQIADASIITDSKTVSPLAIQVIRPDTLNIGLTAINKNSTSKISILCFSKKKKEFANSRIDAVIADCDVVDKVNEYQKSTPMPFWKQVFLGNWEVQIVKTLVYALLVFLLLVLYALIRDKVDNIIEKRKAKERISVIQQKLDRKEPLNIEYPDYFNKTYETLSSLSQEEIDVLDKLFKQAKQDKMPILELLSNTTLTETEKKAFEKIKNDVKTDDLSSIINYSSLYYTELLLEFFKTGRVTKTIRFKSDN